MATVAFSTRDGFLYTFPEELISRDSYVWKDMFEAHKALSGLAAPPPTPVEDDGATSSKDDAERVPPVVPFDFVLNLDTNALSMDCATWCIVDKQLHNKYKKEGIMGKLMRERLTDDDIHEARILAFEFNL